MLITTTDPLQAVRVITKKDSFPELPCKKRAPYLRNTAMTTEEREAYLKRKNR